MQERFSSATRSEWRRNSRRRLPHVFRNDLALARVTARWSSIHEPFCNRRDLRRRDHQRIHAALSRRLVSAALATAAKMAIASFSAAAADL
jgi:hypothetical protein